MQTLRNYLTTVYVPSSLDLKPNSAQQLTVAVNRFCLWAGRDVLLSELSPEFVTDFLRWLGESGRSPRTVNSKRASIICLWRHAARKGLAPRCELSDIPRRKTARRLPTAWTADEMRLLISRLDEDWLKTLCLVLYETGCRLNAALMLRWEDWDARSRTINLRSETSKTGLEQAARVTESTAAKIEQLRSNSAMMFPCPKDRRWLWRELKRACQAAGLPHTRRDLFQKIRRTTATLTASATSVEMASRQLGHSSINTTIAAYIDPRMLPTTNASDVLPKLT